MPKFTDNIRNKRSVSTLRNTLSNINPSAINQGSPYDFRELKVNGADVLRADRYTKSTYGTTINLSTATQASFLDADATNAIIKIVVAVPGIYRVSFDFSAFIENTTSGGSLEIETQYQLLDDLSEASDFNPQIHYYIDSDAGETPILAVPVHLEHDFVWRNVGTRTVKLQYKTPLIAAVNTYDILPTIVMKSHRICELFEVGL